MAATLGLGGCASGDAVPGPTPALTTPVTRGEVAPTAPVTGADGFPVAVSTGGSPIDSGRIGSAADLPAAFGCPPQVPAITIPAATTAPPRPPAVVSGTVTVQPRATGAATVSPEVVVCGSSIAGDEALYLWYAPTREAKLVALRAALSLSAHVHAGPNWVAGGAIDPTMGRVGGEVYR